MDPRCKKAWEILEQATTKAPVLKQHDLAKQFIMDTDVSRLGLGAGLLQRDDEGELHPCPYASRKLTVQERNYSTRELEALAILFPIEKFDDVVGARKSIVITDNKSL